MVRRFVSAAAVACVAVACLAVTVYLLPGINREHVFALLLVWLCAPTVWGVWAMLTPKSWVPARLPSWGAALGVIVGVFAAFFVDVPFRLAGLTLSFRQRALAIVPMVVVYYLLWMIVRGVLAKVSAPDATAGPRHDAARAA